MRRQHAAAASASGSTHQASPAGAAAAALVAQEPALAAGRARPRVSIDAQGAAVDQALQRGRGQGTAGHSVGAGGSAERSRHSRRVHAAASAALTGWHAPPTSVRPVAWQRLHASALPLHASQPAALHCGSGGQGGAFASGCGVRTRRHAFPPPLPSEAAMSSKRHAGRHVTSRRRLTRWHLPPSLPKPGRHAAGQAPSGEEHCALQPAGHFAQRPVFFRKNPAAQASQAVRLEGHAEQRGSAHASHAAVAGSSRWPGWQRVQASGRPAHWAHA